MSVKAWRQVVTPHADIRLGKFDSSVFAADLGEVLAGRGAVDYRDAAHLLRQDLPDATASPACSSTSCSGLSGTGKTEPVIQLQTPFGGGKTHTLLTLYHLLKKPNEVGKLPQIKALIDAAGLKKIPTASVACLVGTALNAASDRTFWGEMAYQLGGDKLYQDGRQERRDRRRPPARHCWAQMLQEAGPCLILLDEILVYLINAGSVQVGESTLRGNTLTFLQELTIAVANCPHAVMIATLTSQLAEFLDENARAGLRIAGEGAGPGREGPADRRRGGNLRGHPPPAV